MENNRNLFLSYQTDIRYKVLSQFLNHQSDDQPSSNDEIQNNTNVLQNHQTRSHPTWSYSIKNKGTSSNKKVLLISLLIFVWCDRGFSQGMPVYDNTNFLALGKSLIESAKQTSQMIKTVKFLKDQKERIDKINSAVKQLKSIKELQDNNTYLYNTVKRDLREILNSPYIKIEEVNTISDSFNGILNNSVQSLDLVNQILKRDFFKMNDSERFRILEEHKKRSNEMVSEIKHKTKMYYEIIDFREMQDLVANRDAIN